MASNKKKIAAAAASRSRSKKKAGPDVVRDGTRPERAKPKAAQAASTDAALTDALTGKHPIGQAEEDAARVPSTEPRTEAEGRKAAEALGGFHHDAPKLKRIPNNETGDKVSGLAEKFHAEMDEKLADQGPPPGIHAQAKANAEENPKSAPEEDRRRLALSKQVGTNLFPRDAAAAGDVVQMRDGSLVPRAGGAPVA